jgi:hypothetical protein
MKIYGRKIETWLCSSGENESEERSGLLNQHHSVTLEQMLVIVIIL